MASNLVSGCDSIPGRTRWLTIEADDTPINSYASWFRSLLYPDATDLIYNALSTFYLVIPSLNDRTALQWVDFP